MTTVPSATRSLASANLICMASLVVWSAGLPAAELIIQLMPSVALAAMRTGLAALSLMAVWVFVEGVRPIRSANWLHGLLVGGLAIGAGSTLLVVGQAYTDAVTVAIISAATPIIGMGLEVLLDGRKVTRALVLGLLLSLAGGMIALAKGGFTLDLGLGALAVIASISVFTWGSRASVTYFPDLTALGRTSITITCAFGVTLVVSLVWSTAGGAPVQWAAFGWREVGALLVCSVGALAISQLLWIMSVDRLGIGLSSLHMNAVPFYVMLIAFAFGADWSWLQTCGAAVVVLGVMIAQGMIRMPAR